MSFDDCSCDYDPPTVYRARFVQARKQYHCEECGRRIEVGERHEYVFGVWYDFGSDQFRTCGFCCDLRQWVKNNIPCFCWAHGNMREDAREAVEDATSRAPEETRGLRFGFGRMLVRERRALRRAA